MERIIDLAEFELVLHDAEFTIWIMDLSKNGHMSHICAGILDNEEEKKAIHNSKFLLQRGMVKLLLGDYLGKKPEEVCVKKDHMGKPFIESECCHINYSHSGYFFMLGASKTNKLGVDIQIPKKLKYDYPTMIFSRKEQNAYESLSDPSVKKVFFWRIWTQKEAFSKALGLGMTINFNELSEYEESNKAITKTGLTEKFYFSYVVLTNEAKEI